MSLELRILLVHYVSDTLPGFFLSIMSPTHCHNINEDILRELAQQNGSEHICEDKVNLDTGQREEG